MIRIVVLLFASLVCYSHGEHDHLRGRDSGRGLRFHFNSNPKPQGKPNGPNRPECPCGTACRIKRRGRPSFEGTCLADNTTCAEVSRDEDAPICNNNVEENQDPVSPQVPPTSFSSCVCGEECIMDDGGTMGVCQTDGQTCAQNIRPPDCNNGDNMGKPDCSTVRCAGPPFSNQNGVCYGPIPPDQCCPMVVHCDELPDMTPVSPSPMECPIPGQEYLSCGPHCPPTCEDPMPTCIFQCVPGCYCARGTVWDGTACVDPKECTCDNVKCKGEPNTNYDCTVNEDGGEHCETCFGDKPDAGCCAPEIPCPTSCPEGRVYMECGSACPMDCETVLHNPMRPCILMCVQGCFCPRGTVIAGDGSCVEPEECARLEKECPAPKIWQDGCGTACPATCSDPDAPQTCELDACIQGCVCPPDMVLVDGSDKCVPLEECPDCSAEECEGEPFTNYYNDDGSLDRCYGGIVGCCATRIRCPMDDPVVVETCDKGKEFMECGTACPASCANPEPRECIDVCVRGCFCPPGMLLGWDREECYTPEECPDRLPDPSPLPPVTPPSNCEYKPFEKIDTDGDNVYDLCFGGATEKCPEEVPCCPGLEIYDTCGTACEATCDNPRPAECTEQCVMGCFCPNGWVRDENKRCIPYDECNFD